jgi:hypothetical protein
VKGIRVFVCTYMEISGDLYKYYTVTYVDCTLVYNRLYFSNSTGDGQLVATRDGWIRGTAANAPKILRANDEWIQCASDE